MTAPSDPPPGPPADDAPPDPLVSQDQTTESQRRPWGWIAGCAVLALAVLGTTIWALSAQSDLDHQREQTAAAQQQAEQAGNEADALSAQVNALTQDVNNAIEQAGQAGAEAKGNLEAALADLKQRLSQVKPPAGGSGSPAPPGTPTATPAENATPGGP